MNDNNSEKLSVPTCTTCGDVGCPACADRGRFPSATIIVSTTQNDVSDRMTNSDGNQPQEKALCGCGDVIVGEGSATIGPWCANCVASDRNRSAVGASLWKFIESTWNGKDLREEIFVNGKDLAQIAEGTSSAFSVKTAGERTFDDFAATIRFSDETLPAVRALVLLVAESAWDAARAVTSDARQISTELIEQRARVYAGAMDTTVAEVAYEAVIDTGRWAQRLRAPAGTPTKQQVEALKLPVPPLFADEPVPYATLAWNDAIKKAAALFVECSAKPEPCDFCGGTPLDETAWQQHMVDVHDAPR